MTISGDVLDEPLLSWKLACPSCRSDAVVAQPDELRCTSCASVFPKVDGIWRCLAPHRTDAFARFEQEYETVRRAEGWGTDDSAYYRALPWRDLTGRFAELWKLRARSFAVVCERVLPALELRKTGPLRILDLGCGNGWLSYRLTLRGHDLAAIDIHLDPRDGLAAHVYYDLPLSSVQAEFDRLPVADDQIDVAVFNGSLHYSPDYEVSLREALRVLRRTGLIVVIDTPTYNSADMGQRMVEERYARFRETYGFKSDALQAEHFMTPDRVSELGETLGIRWHLVYPNHGLRWRLRPMLARLRGHREPAQFPVMVGACS
jgi:SAM-dependent methyltransferase